MVFNEVMNKTQTPATETDICGICGYEVPADGSWAAVEELGIVHLFCADGLEDEDY